MAILVPSSGSTLDAPSAVYGSSAAGAIVWLQMVAAFTTGASALIYSDSTSTAGRQIARLSAPASTMGPLWGPIISSCQIYIGNLGGGCVNVLVKPLVG